MSKQTRPQCKYSSSNNQQNKRMKISNQPSASSSSFSFQYLVILAACMLMMITNLPSTESFCITPPSTRSSSIGIQSVSSRTFSKSHFKTQSTILSLATIDSPPTSSASGMSSFQRRMLERMNPTKKKSPIPNRKIPPNLMKIETLQEYKNIVGGNTDKLVVVRFYAPWCKACKAIAPAFYRLAATYTNAIFIDVPVTPENANLHQGLGVTSLPFGHIYHPTGGLVEETKMSKKHFANFARVLKSYANGLCNVEEHEELELKLKVAESDDEEDSVLVN